MVLVVAPLDAPMHLHQGHNSHGSLLVNEWTWCNTNDVLFLCNMKLFQWVTWLTNSPLAWLKLSWNYTVVWGSYYWTLLPCLLPSGQTFVSHQGLFLPTPTLFPLPFTVVTLSCTSNPSWHLLLAGPKLTMTMIFILSQKAKSR